MKLIKNQSVIVVTMLLLALLCISILFAVTIGSVDISLFKVYQIMLHALSGSGSNNFDGMFYDIVIYIRLPRIILAAAVGMILGTSGVVMQAIVRNPMADPYTLGVSSGASLGATIAILFGVGAFWGEYAIGVFAFIGALTTALLVIALAGVGGKSSSIRLLLSGLALSAICSAFSSFIIFVANDTEGIRDITYWLMGSVAGAKWGSNSILALVAIIVVVIFVSQYRTLNLMLLGDDTSITLGKNLKTYRIVYLIIVSLAVGFAVFSSGVIGFVGLIIPHIVRMFFGTDHRKTVIFSALIGAIFLVWVDVASRAIIPHSEIPIGVLTAMLGGPFFIYLMIRKSYGFGV